eukprot:1437104-Pyramimonas_sp.AAC.1
MHGLRRYCERKSSLRSIGSRPSPLRCRDPAGGSCRRTCRPRPTETSRRMAHPKAWGLDR